MRKDHEKLSNLIVVGGWMTGIGIIGGMGSFISLVLFPVLPFVVLTAACGVSLVVGLVLLGFSLGTGIRSERGGNRAAVVLTYPDVKIIARFGTNFIGETVFSDADLDMEDADTKLYIQLITTERQRLELKTRQEVWYAAGEGMRGTALIQGDWLVGFSPTIGSGTGEANR